MRSGRTLKKVGICQDDNTPILRLVLSKRSDPAEPKRMGDLASGRFGSIGEDSTPLGVDNLLLQFPGHGTKAGIFLETALDLIGPV